MKKNIKNLAVFVCICSVITLLLAVTNFITAPIIAKNQNAAANQALMEVMPEASGFEVVDISALSLPATVTEVNRETSGLGYVIKLKTAGYGSDMHIRAVACGFKFDYIPETRCFSVHFGYGCGQGKSADINHFKTARFRHYFHKRLIGSRILILCNNGSRDKVCNCKQ